MKSITTFDLVLIPFPFSDLSSTKRRPCLVVRRFDVRKLGAYLVVCMVTSQLDGIKFPGDMVIQDWEEAGLPKPSLARFMKLVSIEEGLALKRLGKLSAGDQKSARANWAEMFGDL
jgi:mRNA interferase MazF